MKPRTSYLASDRGFLFAGQRQEGARCNLLATSQSKESLFKGRALCLMANGHCITGCNDTPVRHDHHAVTKRTDLVEHMAGKDDARSLVCMRRSTSRRPRAVGMSRPFVGSSKST